MMQYYTPVHVGAYFPALSLCSDARKYTWHSLNPMICVITEKGQLLPLSLTMYWKIATLKCHIS